MPPTEEQTDFNANTIIFSASKNELFKIHDNYKTFHRKLKIYWKVITLKEELSYSLIKGCSVLILAGCRSPLTLTELDSLQSYLDEGGSIFVLLAEGVLMPQSNINIFLERYGIVPNSDCLVRTHYHKYFYPKECFIGDSEINKMLLKDYEKKLEFVYPYGATLGVGKPSMVAFTSGITTYPLNRPLSAVYVHQASGGKIAVVGSGQMFADKFIDKENNDKLREMFITFLTSTESIKLDLNDQDDMDSWEYSAVPDIAELAEKPKACLTEPIAHAVPIDYTKLFNTKLFAISTDLVPQVLDLYEKLNVEHGPLKLISPQFEVPLPPVHMAVFPPCFRDLPPPPLELFDLDDAFSSEFTRLAQFTNKYSTGEEDVAEGERELEFYVQECARIVGLEPHCTDPKEILYSVAVKCAHYKNQDAGNK